MAGDNVAWYSFLEADHRLEEVAKTKECSVFRLNGSGGDGVLTSYRVFDGVYLIYQDYHLSGCNGLATACDEILQVVYCRVCLWISRR